MPHAIVTVSSERRTARKRGSPPSSQATRPKQVIQSQEIRRITHDFNNLLTLVMGHGETVLLSLPEGHPLQANAQEIVRAAADAARLLRTFSGITSPARPL
jgi:hypothetical protein